jgi:hypothetical protein
LNIFEWLTSRFSGRGKAMSLYRRGMERAKRQDHAGAVDDYTATINMPRVPSDVKAMALFNRALVLAADGDNPLALDDLNMVLAMAETPTEVRTEARRKLVRMERQSTKTNGEPHPTTSRAHGVTHAGPHSRTETHGT